MPVKGQAAYLEYKKLSLTSFPMWKKMHDKTLPGQVDLDKIQDT